MKEQIKFAKGKRLWINSDLHPEWVAIRVIKETDLNGMMEVIFLSGSHKGKEKKLGLGIDYDIFPNVDFVKFEEMKRNFDGKNIEDVDSLFVEVTKSCFEK